MEKRRKWNMCWLLGLCLFIGTACSGDGGKEEETPPPSTKEETQPVELQGNEARKLMQILEKMDAKRALEIGTIATITDEQFEEIKAFTSELIAGKSGYAAYKAIFKWVCANIQFDHSDNSPYAVFKNKKGVCQGYANLLKVMCISQGIPTLGVNGAMDPTGRNEGHAWNYVWTGEKWMVSDPTNDRDWEMVKDVTMYDRVVEPWSTDVAIEEDEEYVYGFYKGININRIKVNKAQVTLPDTVLGFYITTCNPQVEIPKGIEELTLSRYITNLGEQNSYGLELNASSLKRILFDENNKHFESHEGIIYAKGVEQGLPLLIPRGMPVVKLKAANVFGKNEAVVWHHAVEEIYFAEGTETIESYAVEECPKLKTIHVPKATICARDAFPADVQVVKF